MMVLWLWGEYYSAHSDTVTGMIIKVNKDGIFSSSKVEQIAHFINIYPNPSNGNLKVESDVYQELKIKATNLLGQMVYCGDLKSELELSYLPNGQYLISFYIKDQLITTKPWIKM